MAHDIRARIAGLEAKATADRQYMDAAEAHIAGLEAQRDDWRMSFRGEEMRAEQAEAEVEKLRLITVKGVPAGVDVDLYYDQWKQADDALAAKDEQIAALIADWNKEHPKRLDAEAALAERDRMLRLVFDAYGDWWPQSISLFDDWLADLKARAEEGRES
jgi:multidrug resistance efflux pump